MQWVLCIYSDTKMHFYGKTLPYFSCRLLLVYSGKKVASSQQLSLGINFLRQLDLHKVWVFLDNI